jgi:hypothetical protein
MVRRYFILVALASAIIGHISADESAMPTPGSVGICFTVIGSDIGASVYPDPKTSGIDTISGSGLGISWFLAPGIRLHGNVDLSYNLYSYSNKDTSQVLTVGLTSDLDFAFLRSGRVMMYAGPFIEGDWVTGSYYTDFSTTTASVQGFNITAGGVLGAEYFVSSQFSIGAYCPVTVRYAWTTTTIAVAALPTELNVVGFQGLYAVLSYYF